MSVHRKSVSACLVTVLALGMATVFIGSVAQAARQDGYNDHQHMMDQLGIKRLRPGANPNNQDTFDEATANPYADTMPDVLTMKDGTKVTSAAQWRRRRAQIVEDFEREIYGRIPANVPKVTWEVTGTTEGQSDGIPTVTKTLVGHVDNSACPDITVDIQAKFTVPAEATAAVPIMIEFDFGWFGRQSGLRPWQRLAIAKGWGYGSITPNSIQPDRGGMNLRQGIIGLTNEGAPRTPDQWGALRAWGWGISRLIDYFETNPDVGVDPDKVGIEGVSRYGKAALVAAAFDERIAVAFVASSGEGGAKLHRHIFGEAVENLTGRGEYHWMAGNFLKYGAADPCMTAADLPVDSHELIALCAPRPCFISYGVIPGDPPWVDAHGSFMAGVLASPVYELLGKKGFGTSGDYLTDPMPPVGTLIGGGLAWRQHEGGHTAGPNWPAFFAWVAQYIEAPPLSSSAQGPIRERVPFNADWRFAKGDPNGVADRLHYDNIRDWVLPTGASFTKDPNYANRTRPAGNLAADVAYTQPRFDDGKWRTVTLPHDWAIEGPFDPHAPGGTGKLPFAGVGWYRKHFAVSADERGRQFYLEVGGAMSYANVWLNGQYVGGWPYGYASWRVDLTPYVRFGGENVVTIRLDNPPNSSRWYPGGGIYRNVWLTKTEPVHVGQWGTFVATRDVSQAFATIDLEVAIDNDSEIDAAVVVTTDIYALDADGSKTGDAVGSLEPLRTLIPAGDSVKVKGSVTIENPCLWGPLPTQTPHRYVAVTTLRLQEEIVDRFETYFGIRALRFDPKKGIHVNGERICIKGANQHHDLGALGAAFNVRAAERQLEILREMGCNAIRMAHNPPAPELLELADRMGFLVVDEIFDVWERKKTPLDFHLIFPDWHEQDLRALVRRDRNHPSVIMWSFGNEVGEQFTGEEGATVAQRLHDIAKEEDPTRPTTTAMNYAKPDMPMPKVPDVISLNYQGEGIRDAPAYSGLKGIRTPPLYPAFHETFPDKVILSSETAAALSTRGTYLFPVFDGVSAPVKDGLGGDSNDHCVSAYELHTADFGSSADKVFAALDKHRYVAGGFVWSGWDYLGEPTPYYSSRSSYFGVIDLAGFKKDRFYLYQSYWRPDLAMAHILPHWTWPQRVGEITPVHVFTSGDEAELFLNDKSLGRKKKGPYEYRLRWDQVKYEPGTLTVVAYKGGKKWAEAMVHTAGEPAGLEALADCDAIRADGEDLAFVTVRVIDKNGRTVPYANSALKFTVEGAGELVATDNGDPTDLVSFSSHDREAFNGLCLVIVRGIAGQAGTITLKAESQSLQSTTVTLQSAVGSERKP